MSCTEGALKQSSTTARSRKCLNVREARTPRSYAPDPRGASLRHTDQPVVATLLTLTLLSQRMTLVFGGDVIPHDPVKSVAAAHAKSGEDGNNDGWDHVLGPLAPAFNHADFAVVNLETPIVTLKKPESGEMVFSGPPALLHSLKKVGVDVATFANNHCLDQHREGIVSTREYLKEAQLLSAGADVDFEHAWAPLVLEKNGVRVGILSFTRFLNGFNNKKDPAQPHVPVLNYANEPIIGSVTMDALYATIRARAAEVDALIVFVHWGAEYKFEPAPEDRKLAKAMLDAGAFAVVGHHPHVLQPVEFIERSAGGKGLVAFSLGNLISNQDYADVNGTKRDGLLLELELVKDGDVMRLEKVTPIPIGTENTLGRGKKRNVQATLVDEQLLAIEERLVELAGRNEPAAKKERTLLEWRRQVALARLARIKTFTKSLEAPDEIQLSRSPAAVVGVPASSP